MLIDLEFDHSFDGTVFPSFEEAIPLPANVSAEDEDLVGLSDVPGPEISAGSEDSAAGPVIKPCITLVVPSGKFAKCVHSVLAGLHVVHLAHRSVPLQRNRYF